jgi:CheY-like chemotaxis protein
MLAAPLAPDIPLMSEPILWLLIGTGLCLLVAWQWQRRRAAEAQRAAEKQAEERQAEQRRLADEQAARQAALQAEREAEARAEAQRQAERRDAEARQAAERAEAERLEAERLEVARQRAAAEQAAREAAARAEAQRQAEWRAEQERLAAARAKAERIEAERIEAERIEAARLEAERLAAEHAAAERLEAERVAAERAAAAAAPRVAKTAAQTLVLVADDSKVVRIKTGRLLAQHQYRVAYASDGLDAVQQLQAQQPDLLITDVEMPGMDGFELTRHIRGNPQTAQLPVIMITAADDRHREQADAAGVSVLLGKPYAEDALVAHLRLALGQDGSAAAAVADSRHGVLDALA